MKIKLLMALLGIIMFAVIVTATYYPSGLGSLESFPANINLESPFNVTATNLISSENIYAGSGTEWLSIYLSGSIGYFNSTFPIVFTNNVSTNSYYGEMWIQNETGYVTTTITSSNVWYNLTGFNSTIVETGQSLNGFTYDDANEHLTVLIAGKYRAVYSVSAGNAGNNQEYEFAVAINSLVQNNTVTHRKIQTNGDVGDVGGSGLIDLSVNDNVHLMTSNKDGTADIQTHAMNLNLIRIGD